MTVSHYPQGPDATRSTKKPLSYSWLVVALIVVAVGAIVAVSRETAVPFGIVMLVKAQIARRANDCGALRPGAPVRIGEAWAPSVDMKSLARHALPGRRRRELFR
jgi:hypothetical protein